MIQFADKIHQQIYVVADVFIQYGIDQTKVGNKEIMDYYARNTIGKGIKELVPKQKK